MTAYQNYSFLPMPYYSLKKKKLPGLFVKLQQAFVSLSSFMRDPWKEVRKEINSAATVKTNLSTMASKHDQWFLMSLYQQAL